MKRFVLAFTINLFIVAIGNSQFQTALEFNGVGSYVHIAHDNSLSMTNSMTIEAIVWAENYDPGGWQEFVFKGGNFPSDPNGEPREYYLRPRNGDGRAEFRLHDSTDDGSSATSNSPLIPGTCYHLAGTFDGNVMRLYVNGELHEADTIGPVSIQVGQGSLTFGRLGDTSAEYFDGNLDEIRLWNIARTQEEICTYINDTLPASIYQNPESGLVGYWRLDEGSGFTAIDPSTMGNDGSLENDPQFTSSCTSSSCSLASLDAVNTEFVLSPNPVSDFLKVRSERLILTITLHDMAGNKVYEFSPNSKSLNIDTSAMQSGLYIIRLKTKDGLGFAKVIVK